MAVLRVIARFVRFVGLSILGPAALFALAFLLHALSAHEPLFTFVRIVLGLVGIAAFVAFLVLYFRLIHRLPISQRRRDPRAGLYTLLAADAFILVFLAATYR